MNGEEHQIATSVLVIGTGGAGLRAAIELAERGVDVLAIGKRRKADAHTTLAAGGINAALATMDPEDSWQQHAADTLKESYLLADPETVRIVTENAVILAAGGHTRIWCRTSSRRDEDTGGFPPPRRTRRRPDPRRRARAVPPVGPHRAGERRGHARLGGTARGEGGILRNALGERFMARYNPERMELSTRDRVRPQDHGTGVDGLYAIGEAASGLHGANRLGGNSLDRTAGLRPHRRRRSRALLTRPASAAAVAVGHGRRTR